MEGKQKAPLKLGNAISNRKNRGLARAVKEGSKHGDLVRRDEKAQFRGASRRAVRMERQPAVHGRLQAGGSEGGSGLDGYKERIYSSKGQCKEIAADFNLKSRKAVHWGRLKKERRPSRG